MYKQPVFVYIPGGGELRGGAWVVIDSQINPTHMETFADPAARGGVLEPEGVVEIKFRKPDLIKAMHRCVGTREQTHTHSWCSNKLRHDPGAWPLHHRALLRCRHLDLFSCVVRCRLDPVIRKAKATGGAVAEATIKAREKELLPAYQQMALRFADMHDTPQRM